MSTWLSRSLARRVALTAAAIAAGASTVIGLLVVGVVLADQPPEVREAVQWVALAGGATTVLTVTVGTWLIVELRLARKLRRLTKMVQAAERGKYLMSARESAPDELGELSRAFDHLCTQITDLSVAVIDGDRELAATRHELKLKDALALLFELTQSINEETDVEAILRAIPGRVAPALGVQEMTILLLDPQSGQLTVRATAGFPADEDPTGMVFSAHEGVVGAVADSGRSVYVPDTARDSRYLHWKGQHAVDGSYLCVPMKLGGRLAGVFGALRTGTSQFTEADLRLLESLASYTALALAHAEMTARLRDLAVTDDLTQVANRRLLMERLQREVERARRGGRELAAMVLDLDHFKRVNDEHGHQRGDEVLRGVAHALAGHVRRMDTVGRYGGEEFVVLLPESSRAQAMVVAEKLREAVKGLSFGEGVRLTVSIGVAVMPEDAVDGPGLVEAADRALYAAKRAGRDRVVAFTRALYEQEPPSPEPRSA